MKEIITKKKKKLRGEARLLHSRSIDSIPAGKSCRGIENYLDARIQGSDINCRELFARRISSILHAFRLGERNLKYLFGCFCFAYHRSLKKYSLTIAFHGTAFSHSSIYLVDSSGFNFFCNCVVTMF